MGQYSAEIKKRRTFAIISHPDAGKTTLTEKLLLFGIAYFLPIGTRIAALFGPYLIIFLPNLIKSTISVKKYETIAIMLVVIICWIQYFIRLSINNIGTTMPYLFYWE